MHARCMALVCSLGIAAAVAAQTTAFVDVNVVPMDRHTVLVHRVVLVENGTIIAVGARDSIAIPATARRIEGHGQAYLLPGLVDSHTHLELTERRWLGVFLRSGVTTVFNLRG